MPVNSIAKNVLGTIGTVCWSGQLIPQIWKSWREKSTTGLSPFLVLVWGLSGLPLGVYTILQDLSIPLIVQPQIFSFLTLFSWGQCLYYSKGKTSLVAALITGSVMLVVGGLEVGMVFAVRPSMNRRAIDFFGISTSVMIACGLLPQYYEIIKRKEVIGISILFMAIDCLGGIFSLISLFFRPKFDVLAGVAYSLIIAMDGVVILAAIILNPPARRHRRQEARHSNPSPATTQMNSPEISLEKECIPSIEPIRLGRV